MKFQEWITKNKTTVTAVAKKLGVESWTIARYANGDRLPEPGFMLKIHRLTNGAVEPNDFYNLARPAAKKKAAPKKKAAKARPAAKVVAKPAAKIAVAKQPAPPIAEPKAA